VGVSGGAVRSDGDANVDGWVDSTDLGVWKDAFANAALTSAAATASARAAVVDEALAAPDQRDWSAGTGTLDSGHYWAAARLSESLTDSAFTTDSAFDAVFKERTRRPEDFSERATATVASVDDGAERDERARRHVAASRGNAFDAVGSNEPRQLDGALADAATDIGLKPAFSFRPLGM
jgi:hypothetical protein